MSSLGLGVMIQALGGNKETIAAINDAKERTITEIKLENNRLNIRLESGKTLSLWDDGQSCCEHRYMEAKDDNFDYYRGAKLLGLETTAPTETKQGDFDECKEEQFLIVKTDRGNFTVANYNENNGYYGGFWLKAQMSGGNEDEKVVGVGPDPSGK